MRSNVRLHGLSHESGYQRAYQFSIPAVTPVDSGEKDNRFELAKRTGNRRPAAVADSPRDASQAPTAPETDQTLNPASSPPTVVGVGASAGGLEAFTELLSHLPDDTGMAFVLIQHLDPKHESHLTELLSKASKMPVSEVTRRDSR